MVEEPVASPRARRPGKAALKLVAPIVIAGILALLVWATLASSRGQNFAQQIADGKRPPAPAFSLPIIWRATGNWPPGMVARLSDGRLSLAELRGQVVVINFFASWCVTCRDEAPYLRAAARKYADRVVFLGIDVQDFGSDARKFAAKYRMNYVAIRNSDDSLFRSFGLTGVPETFYLDRRSRAAAHSPGGVTEPGLELGIAAALASK